MSRESNNSPPSQIFTEPEIKEPSEVTAQRERKFKEDFLAGGRSQNTKKYEAFFNRLDFKVLHDIFLEFATNRGVSDTEINFLGRDQIFSLENTMKGGE